MAARGERRPSFDEEEDDEPEHYPAASKRDESDDSCSWTVVRTASFGATLIFFVLLAVWNPGNGTHHGHKHRRNRPKQKPLWPPAGQEVQGCNPVGNASTGLPVNRIARVFLLQRDERKNLADMINYHRQGLSPDQIVVLDHRSDDALTRRVLTRFSAAGGHVWRCERDFAHHRADMMSSVMRLYAPFSTYLIPLDADEMLAVSAKGSLTWGAAELNTALAALPEAAKMFKVRTTAGVPHDWCAAAAPTSATIDLPPPSHRTEAAGRAGRAGQAGAAPARDEDASPPPPSHPPLALPTHPPPPSCLRNAAPTCHTARARRRAGPRGWSPRSASAPHGHSTP
jgi:hypothetical protein